MNKKTLITLFLNLLISFIISGVGLVQLKISGLSSNNEYYLNYSTYPIYKIPVLENTKSFINSDNKYKLHNILVTDAFGRNLISLNVNRVFGVDYLHYLYINSNKLIKFNIVNKSTSQLNSSLKMEIPNYLKHTLIVFLILTFTEWLLIKIRYLFLALGKLFRFDLGAYEVHSMISVSLFLSSIAIFSIAYFTQLIDSNIFFNSDILFLVDLLRDLFNGGSINDWYMPGQMSFFPDLVIIAIIMGFTKNVYYIFYWVAIVQLLLYFLLCYFVSKSILSLRISLFLSGSLIWICIFLSIFYPNAFSVILIPGSHFGSLLNELLLLGIFIRLYNLKFRNLRLYIIFIFILIISIISDRFIILWFLLPLILSILIMIIHGSVKPCLFKKIIYFIIISLASTLISIIILKVGFTHSFQPKTYFIFQDKRDFLKKIVLLIMGFKDQSFYIVSILDILVWMLAVSIYKNNLQSKIYLEQKPSSRIIYLLYLFSVPIMFLALILVSYFTFTPRYLLMISCVSIVVFLIFISKINSKGLIVLISICFLYLVYSLAGLSIKTEYYPLDIKCIDDTLSTHQAKYGIAQYWDARRFNYLTHIGADIVPINYLKDDVNLNNSNISSHFLWMDTEKHNRITYDFALVNRESSIVTEFDLNTKKILTQNSSLVADVLCPEHRVLIFKPDTLVKY